MSTPTPARKVTPIGSSKTWKENLRRACLSRARRRRSLPCTTPKIDGNDRYRPALSNSDGRTDSTPFLPISDDAARDMIEEELRQRSIAIQMSWSHSSAQPHAIANSTAPAPAPAVAIDWDGAEDSSQMDTGEKESDDPSSYENLLPRVNHFITEEELYELLTEVQNELDLDEANHNEQIFAMAQHEMENFQSQVNDYEEWQDKKCGEQEIDCDSSLSVSCPICFRGTLIQHQSPFDFSDSGRCILCPNSIDGSCSLRLENPSAASLFDLHGRLQWVCSNHSASCNSSVTFQIVHQQLCAACRFCNLWTAIT